MPTETGRHRLYEKIKEAWGEEHAAELMSYLPPVGWADVATKQDLALLSAEIRVELAEFRTEFAGLRAEVSDKIAGMQKTMISLMVLLTAIFSAITTIAAIAS